MNAVDCATAISAIEKAVAVVPERTQFPRGPCGSGAPPNARHAVRLTIRARISVRDRPKTRGSDGRGHAPTLRSGKVLVKAFAMARSVRRHPGLRSTAKGGLPQVRVLWVGRSGALGKEALSELSQDPRFGVNGNSNRPASRVPSEASRMIRPSCAGYATTADAT